MNSEGENLRRIRVSELNTGEVLPGHVRDSAGRILIRAGQIMTAEHLDTLRERTAGIIYVGLDWPREPVASERNDVTPEEVLDALRQRRSTKGSKKIRKHERHAWCVSLTLELQESHMEGVRRRQVAVTTHDISAGGFAFIFNQFIHPGTTIRAHFEALPNKPQLSGVVCNCVHLSGNQHRVGVQITRSEDR